MKGAIAQLGERNTGSVEVGGSIPPSSTKLIFDNADSGLSLTKFKKRFDGIAGST